MTTMELRTAFIKEAGEIIAADDHTVEKALNYLRRIRAQMRSSQLKEDSLPPYTIEELNARIAQSLEDAKTGKFITGEEMKQRMDIFLQTCCK